MRKPDLSGQSPSTASAAGIDSFAEPINTTGRHIVIFRAGGLDAGIQALKAAGLKVVVSDAASLDVVKEEEIGDAEVLVFPTLGVAVLGAEASQVLQLENVAADSSGPLLSVKPEKIRYALPYAATAAAPEEISPANGNGNTQDYLRGYRSAVVHLEEELTNYRAATLTNVSFGVNDESKATWGLQVTKASVSQQSGQGIKIAVLDTGFDFTEEQNGNFSFHPDFLGRNFTTKSFVTGAPTAKDGHGHGTHCVGTACGPRLPSTLPRYGVAYDSDIFVGKVLNDLGGGADGWIIAGIEWAIKNGCQVISMSLGSRKKPGDPFNEIYENIARRALDAGTLIIAAAGNESGRPGLINPVGGPADCPSIMAVAAIDSDFKVATFSNGGINPNGGEVDVAGPGVSIRSSFPMPTGHSRLSGTSMATPHVAGIAALYAQSNPQARGRTLWKLITANARQLPFASTDVGAGLVLAP